MYSTFQESRDWRSTGAHATGWIAVRVITAIVSEIHGAIVGCRASGVEVIDEIRESATALKPNCFWGSSLAKAKFPLDRHPL
jgi:hypothetical protein